MLADVILVTHALIVGFIALGFVVIPLGNLCHWRFVRHRSLRLLHLGGILFVAAEALLGITCPLTVWEDALRGATDGDGGFIVRWLSWLLYYNVPLWIFSLIYVVAALLALSLWRWVPVERKRD
ncbi:MAG: DUF2784 domain-containing protein [Gammaproteobacteria bacterium]|nr:DUF2784 domain-containing protein [Gammaproteobacteria bacterium]